MDTAIQTIQQLDFKMLVAIGVLIFGACGVMGKIMMIGFNQVNTRIDKLQETVTDIDRRLCRLEGAFHSKKCCLLKSDINHKKVE